MKSGMPGRKRVPTHLKIMRGNPGGRPLNHREPIPRGNLKEAPEWMTEDQKAAWNYAIENAPAGLLKKLDASVLVTWVIAQDLHRTASQHVSEHGRTVVNEKTLCVSISPEVNIIEKASGIMIRSASELGFTPASRSKVQLPPDENSGKDQWDELDEMLG